MGSPIATKKSGFLCFAFPDVCKTQVGPATVPIPYPNIGNLGDATGASTNVFAGGDPVIHKGSKISATSGDEAGSLGAVNSKPPNQIKGEVEFTGASGSVYVNGQPVVRMFDSTNQNNGNAVGRVLMGFPTVFVGD
jgi:hypothetical protein